MNYLIIIFVGLVFYFGASTSQAIDFNYKKIEEFKTLEEFSSVNEFEEYYGKYIQHCLDNTYGGTGGIRCLVSAKLWDRELNINYNKLAPELTNSEKIKLKESQLAWLKVRDLSIELTNQLLDKKYSDQGTMFLLMRAGDFDSMIAKIIKERVLTIKAWKNLKRQA